MTTTKVAYAGASGVAITLTKAGLADGSWRQSASVDNTSNLYLDALVGMSVQTGTSPVAGGTIDIYAYGQYDGSAEFTGGASGSDAAYTADGEELLFKLIGVIVVDATSDQDYEFGPVAIARFFGGFLPQRWGIVIENNTGVALNATGTNNETLYTGIHITTA